MIVVLIVALWLVVLVFAWGLCVAAGRTLPRPSRRDAQNARTGSREGA